MKNLLLFSCVFQLILLVGCKAKELTPEQQAKANEYTEMIEAADFIFVPNNAQPMSGRSINLNADYSLKISEDTIVAYLPYFGRAYVAPSNSSEGGIKFTSTDFDYNSTLKKNGTYEIKITPKDVTSVELRGIELSLSAGNSGYANLRVQMTNRQGISYSGVIQKEE